MKTGTRPRNAIPSNLEEELGLMHKAEARRQETDKEENGHKEMEAVGLDGSFAYSGHCGR